MESKNSHSRIKDEKKKRRGINIRQGVLKSISSACLRFNEEAECISFSDESSRNLATLVNQFGNSILIAWYSAKAIRTDMEPF